VNPNAASSAFTSASVRASTVPGAPVMRSVVSSWKTTTTPSLVRRTSVSIASAPSSAARSKAARVFSGARALPPRCATSQGEGRERKGCMGWAGERARTTTTGMTNTTTTGMDDYDDD
jgi:hypothetical protein